MLLQTCYKHEFAILRFHPIPLHQVLQYLHSRSMYEATTSVRPNFSVQWVDLYYSKRSGHSTVAELVFMQPALWGVIVLD